MKKFYKLGDSDVRMFKYGQTNPSNGFYYQRQVFAPFWSIFFSLEVDTLWIRW